MGGGLLIVDSKIVLIGKKEDFGDLNSFQGKIIDHGKSLICPGFINLHTHLFYSSLNLIECPDGLFPWLEKLIDKTTQWSEKELKLSTEEGIKKAISTGTTYLVENTPSNLSAEMISRYPLKATIGLEIFSSDEKEAEKIFLQSVKEITQLNNHLNGQDKSCPYTTSRLEFTLSPHAPYNVSVSLWEKLMAWLKENNKPLLTHLEESPQEKIWWNEKSGPALKFWEKIKKLDPKLKYWKRYDSGIDFLNKNDLLNENIIATHLSQINNNDLNILKTHNIKLVHCPRSNYYLNNGTANLKLWNKLGFLWGIGTDSTASNNDLDLLNEARFAINQQSIIYNNQISAKEMFAAMTINAAKILGKDSEIGALQKGLSADFLIYDIKNKSGCTYQDPYHLLIFETNNSEDLKEVWINGNRAWLNAPILNKM